MQRTPSLFVALAVAAVAGCDKSPSPQSGPGRDEPVTLVFHLELNPEVYQDSLWADPPQLAVWLENEADETIQMVKVTHNTGANYWVGKVECSVALPFWVTFYNKQTGTEGPPTWDHPAPDSITCATPKTELTAEATVPGGTRWTYYVEVNVSGDYNATFQRMSMTAGSDRYGNGQPSLIYRGFIDATPGSTSRPELIGRTDQYMATGQIDEDLTGITTAKELLREITVSSTSP